MRRVGRQAIRRHFAARHKPQPAWLIQVRRGAKLLAVPALLLAVTVAAFEFGYMRALSDRMGAWIIAQADRHGMHVKHILVNGEERTDHNILRSVLASHTGSIILTVDKRKLKKDLESLPWVRNAKVRVLLPDTIMVVIDEHRPFAWWRHQEAIHLVSDRGEVIPQRNRAPATLQLPIIAGLGAPQAAEDLFTALRSEPSLFKRLTAAHLVNGRRWNVYLDGRTEVRLPADNIKSAWRRLAHRERREQLLERAIAKIDLRNDDWIILELEDSIMSGNVRTKA